MANLTWISSKTARGGVNPPTNKQKYKYKKIKIMIYAVKTNKRTVKAYQKREMAEKYIKEHPNKDYTIQEINI